VGYSSIVVSLVAGGRLARTKMVSVGGLVRAYWVAVRSSTFPASRLNICRYSAAKGRRRQGRPSRLFSRCLYVISGPLASEGGISEMVCQTLLAIATIGTQKPLYQTTPHRSCYDWVHVYAMGSLPTISRDTVLISRSMFQWGRLRLLLRLARVFPQE